MRKVLSYGGGVNGVAMVLALMELGERPDHILFADTAGEVDETYQHIEYFNHWLILKGWPTVERVYYTTKKRKRVTLEEEILKAKTLPSVAFGYKTCSQKHKIWPQLQFVKHRYGKESITWFVGFDADEAKRVKANAEPNHINRYPLIEVGWNRARCIEEIENAEIEVPVKSACYYCPNRKKHEILSLSDKFKTRAKAIEANATGLQKVKGLGRRFSWTEFLNGNTADADRAEKQDDKFKEITGEEFEPINCDCL